MPYSLRRGAVINASMFLERKIILELVFTFALPVMGLFTRVNELLWLVEVTVQRRKACFLQNLLSMLPFLFAKGNFGQQISFKKTYSAIRKLMFGGTLKSKSLLERDQN